MHTGRVEHFLQSMNRPAQSAVELRPPMSRYPERRGKIRFPLHCPVTLAAETGGSEISGQTVNISSSGFQALVERPIPPGVVVVCTLTLGAPDLGSPWVLPELRCKAVVVRSEEKPDGSFGLACRIQDYILSPRGRPFVPAE